MSNGKSFLVDLTKCTACRGCQIACKAVEETARRENQKHRSHQNPPDFSFNTLRVVRFSEKEIGRQECSWFFTPDQCRHCLEAPCKSAAEQPDSIIIDETTARSSTPTRPPWRARLDPGHLPLQRAEAGQEDQGHQQVRHVQ